MLSVMLGTESILLGADRLGDGLQLLGLVVNLLLV